jgi:hypothetical protein
MMRYQLETRVRARARYGIALRVAWEGEDKYKY